MLIVYWLIQFTLEKSKVNDFQCYRLSANGKQVILGFIRQARIEYMNNLLSTLLFKWGLHEFSNRIMKPEFLS
jgi:hypothetical protein